MMSCASRGGEGRVADLRMRTDGLPPRVHHESHSSASGRTCSRPTSNNTQMCGWLSRETTRTSAQSADASGRRAQCRDAGL
jgi:hypothetical protein